LLLAAGVVGQGLLGLTQLLGQLEMVVMVGLVLPLLFQALPLLMLEAAEERDCNQMGREVLAVAVLEAALITVLPIQAVEAAVALQQVTAVQAAPALSS
jgi:hypothetical protein